MQANADSTITMRLVGVRYAAHETNIYELEGMDNAVLPPATAGAHVDVHLPTGIVRSYSLLEADRELRRYIIGVKRNAESRGGSSYIHDMLRVGQVLRVSTPRNDFPLEEDAKHTVLIAGGIGITPIWCMVRRLKDLGKAFEFHYACHDARDVVMRKELQEIAEARLHVDAEMGSFLDLNAIVSSAPEGSHFYCCGPAQMLQAYEEATRDIDPARVHLERFGAGQAITLDGGYTVVLQDTGEEFAIPEGKSILDILRDAGHDMAFSCEEGICGSCEMRVLEGEPDHQDMVLSDDERAENKTMMICCSGAKTARLVLASKD